MTQDLKRLRPQTSQFSTNYCYFNNLLLTFLFLYQLLRQNGCQMATKCERQNFLYIKNVIYQDFIGRAEDALNPGFSCTSQWSLASDNQRAPFCMQQTYTGDSQAPMVWLNSSVFMRSFIGNTEADLVHHQHKMSLELCRYQGQILITARSTFVEIQIPLLFPLNLQQPEILSNLLKLLQSTLKP